MIPKVPLQYDKFERSEDAIFTFIISSGFKPNYENVDLYKENLLKIVDKGGI